MNKQQFLEKHPQVFFLDAEHPAQLQEYLQQRDWIQQEQIQQVTSAGEGNMNYTLRVVTNNRSIIVKQARPWVEKYSSIPAPWDRALMEGRFYQVCQNIPQVVEKMPKLLGMDSQSRILLFEDLGNAQDYSFLYQQGELSSEDLQELITYLSDLHQQREVSQEDVANLANREMRQLNHEHIFHLPLVHDNGLNLDNITPGLAKLATELKDNADYVTATKQMGDLYLSDGTTLLHGDFYPGSWLKTPQGIKVIDAEFCFYGMAEFDVGVMIAHLLLARQPQQLLQKFRNLYNAPLAFCYPTALKFTAIEIMRRLLGVAQLPLCQDLHDLQTKQQLLELSRDLLLQQPNKITQYFI